MSLRLFFGFLHERYSTWHDLMNLDRKDMEAYLSWSRAYTEGWKEQTYRYLISLKIFLEYIQRAQYPEAPELPSLLYS